MSRKISPLYLEFLNKDITTIRIKDSEFTVRGFVSQASSGILGKELASYDLIQKGARAKISIILSISRPTSLAVELASQLNLTLACLPKGGGLYIFSGEQRFGK